jgi:hypothetical protein
MCARAVSYSQALSALVLDMQGQIDELKRAQGKGDEARLPIMRKQVSSILSGVGIVASPVQKQESARTLQIPAGSVMRSTSPLLVSPRGTSAAELELIQPGEVCYPRCLLDCLPLVFSFALSTRRAHLCQHLGAACIRP